MSALFALFALLTVLTPLRSTAEESVDQLGHLQRRLEQVQGREDAKYAKGALEQARQALEVAEARQGEAALGAQRIAEAAVVLAERQLARREAQEAFFSAYRRVQEMEARAKAQRRALEALLQERARMARVRGPMP